MRIAAAVLICCAMPAWAVAQRAPPILPENDATITIGWAGSEYERARYDNWRGNLLVAGSVGHSWTDHLKTEFEAGWSSPGKDEIYEDITYLGAMTNAESDHRSSDVRLGATQIYQFGRNAWVHPYLGVGFDIVRRETRIDRSRQFRTVFLPHNRNLPVEIPAASEHRTDVFGQGVLKSGLKMYASERAFSTQNSSSASDATSTMSSGRSGSASILDGRSKHEALLFSGARDVPARAESGFVCREGTPIDRSPEYWYAYASKLPIGSTVRVRTMDGKRQTAALALVDASGIALELKTRIPEPPRRITCNELMQLELAKKNGSSIAKAVAVGAGVGGGIFFVLLAIFFSNWD